MKNESIIEVESIGKLHDLVQFPRSRHPLVSVIDHKEFYARHPKDGVARYRFGFYSISCKRFEGMLYYGKGHYDFNNGSLVFTSPGQIIGAGANLQVTDGWGLFFH